MRTARGRSSAPPVVNGSCQTGRGSWHTASVGNGWFGVVALPLAVAGCHAATPAAETSTADASDASVRDTPDAEDETGSADGSSDMDDMEDAGMDAPDGRAAVNAGADAADAYASDASIDAAIPLPALPLETTSRWIVDSNGKRFKLASVNWY